MLWSWVWRSGIGHFFHPGLFLSAWRVIGTGTEFIQDSVSERTVEVVPDHEIPDFPRQRDELTFSFFGKNET
jgi:hypothetical protein